MTNFGAYFALIRIHNCLIASLGVAAGQYLTPRAAELPLNGFLMAAAFFICAYGNVLNDILDIESDRINHPGRPLPSGKISRPAAVYMLLLLLIASLISITFVGSAARAVALAAILLLALYNFRLKHVAFLGNMVVSFLGGATFVFGGLAIGWEEALMLPGPAIAAGLAFLMHLGREIIKDIGDRPGDIISGSRMSPIMRSTDTALMIAHAIFALLAITSIVVYMVGWFNRWYLIMTLVVVIIPLTVVCGWQTASPNPARFGNAARLIKLLMIPGILALLIGKNY